MKRIFKLIAIVALILTALPACQMKEDDIFDLDPATRQDNWMADYRRVFNNNTYGWALYSDQPTYGRHPHPTTFAAKFDSTWVTLYYVTNQYYPNLTVGDSVKSMYSFKMDNGIVLSFDTYNTLLHNGADQSQYFSQDLQGDFEFDLDHYSANEDTIFGRGKTKQLPFLMIKMQMPAMDYQTAADGMNAYEPYNCVFISQGDTLPARFLSGYGNFLIYPDNNGGTEQLYSYCNLPGGIYLLENITYKDKVIKEMKLREDGEGFDDVNGNASIGPKPYASYWEGAFDDDAMFFSYSQLGTWTQGEWDKMRTALSNDRRQNPDDLHYVCISYRDSTHFSMLFNKWHGSGEIYFDYEWRKVSNDEIAVRYTGNYRTGLGFNVYNAGFKYAVDAFATEDEWKTYKISIIDGTPMQPSGFRWTDESNPDNSFAMPNSWHYYHYSIWE